jgi:hypothetical protein
VETWLAAINRGDDSTATGLWRAPATVETAFPAGGYSLDTPAAVRAFWAGRPCHLKMTAPLSANGNAVTIQVYADGVRPTRLAKGCSSIGTYYVYEITVSGGRIVKLVSLLAPISIAEKWLAAYNHGRDVLAASLWMVPATVQTAFPVATMTFSTLDALQQFWAQQGCHYKLQAPVMVAGDTVTLNLTADRQRTDPHTTPASCTSIGRAYQDQLMLTEGHITSLVSRLRDPVS